MPHVSETWPTLYEVHSIVAEDLIGMNYRFHQLMTEDTERDQLL